MSSITHLQRVRRLYKTILRLHRGLPVEIQSLGNNYLRDEFKRHKTCSSSEANVFLNEWAVRINIIYIYKKYLIYTSRGYVIFYHFYRLNLVDKYSECILDNL